MRIPILYIVTALVAGCSATDSGFTTHEREILDSTPEGEKMRLYLVTDPEDSTVLRAVCDPVEGSMLTDPRYRKLLKGMLSTVNDPENQGVGIAAPQVGINKRIIAVQRFDKDGEPFAFYLNPEIIAASDEMIPSEEGCLSVPDERGCVLRHAAIRITYNDPEDFSVVTEDIAGFTAIIFQHEIDHLSGVLFTDKTVSEDGED